MKKLIASFLSFCLALTCGVASANIGVVQEVGATCNTATTSVSTFTCTINSTTIHDALCATGIISSGTTFTGISNDQSLSWTPEQSATNSTMSRTGEIWCTFNIPGGTTTVSISTSFAQSQYGMVLTEIGQTKTTGPDTSALGNQTSTGTGSNVVTTASASSTNQPALVYGITLLNVANTQLSAGTGFTSVSNFSASSSVGAGWQTESKRVTATGSQTATFGTSQSGASISFMLVFDESSACTHNGYTSGGALVVPNGSSGSYWGEAGNFVTPNCSSTPYWQPTLGNFGLN